MFKDIAKNVSSLWQSTKSKQTSETDPHNARQMLIIALSTA